MRLDKMISSTGIASRSQISAAVRAGRVLVDGAVAKKADMQVDPDKVSVIYCGTPVCYRKYTYIMLNKPEGYVSATEDGKLPTVIELLPEELQSAYAPILTVRDEAVERLVKAADKLSAYIKCVEEQKAGNTEFDSAAQLTMQALRALDMPEMNWFIDNCLEPFSLNLDQL